MCLFPGSCFTPHSLYYFIGWLLFFLYCYRLQDTEFEKLQNEFKTQDNVISKFFFFFFFLSFFSISQVPGDMLLLLLFSC